MQWPQDNYSVFGYKVRQLVQYEPVNLLLTKSVSCVILHYLSLCTYVMGLTPQPIIT